MAIDWNIAKLKEPIVQQERAGRIVREERTYQVLTPRDARDLSGATGIPALGDVHPNNQDLKVADVEYRQNTATAAGRAWEVDVVYVETTAAAEDPIELVSVSGGSSNRTIDFVADHGNEDINTVVYRGMSLQNAAQRRYESSIQVPSGDIRVEIVRNESHLPVERMAFNNTLHFADPESSANLPGGITVPPYGGKLSVAWELSDDSARPYRYTYTVELRQTWVRDPQGSIPNVRIVDTSSGLIDIGWCVAILEQGYSYLDYSGPVKRVPFRSEVTDDLQERTTDEPQPIQGRYKNSAPNATPGAPVEEHNHYYWSVWAPYPVADWTDLELDHGWPEPEEEE